MGRFIVIAVLLIATGIASVMHFVGAVPGGTAALATQAATLPQVLGVLAIAGGVAFLMGARQRTT